MKKNIILLGTLAISGMVFSQVGINTETPRTTMDISAKRDGTGALTDNTQTYGLQAPRLTRAELSSNTSTYGVDQRGALVYITDISGGNTTGQRINITATGYYYFDGSFWQKVSNGTLPTGVDLTDDAFINDSANTMVKLNTNADGTTGRATGTYFVIKDNGNVGIGTENPTNKLDIPTGQARIGTDNNNQTIVGPSYVDFYTSGNGSAVANIAANDGTGNLRINDYGTSKNTWINSKSGNVGIGLGSSEPTAKLHINVATPATGLRLVDTTQGTGKVLISDNSGNASWAATTTLGLDNTNDAFVNDTIGDYAGPMVKLGSKANGSARDTTTDFVITDTGRVGIGTPAPTAALQIVGGATGESSQFNIRSYSDTNASTAYLTKYRGTVTAPTAVANGDVLGINGYYGYDGSAIVTRADVRAVVDGTVSANTVPTSLAFSTGTTALTRRMTISSTGFVGIGTSTPATQLDILSGLSNATLATMGNSTQKLLMGISTTYNGAYITTGAGVTNSLRLGINGGEQIRIDASSATVGNVGISTGNIPVNYSLQVNKLGNVDVYTQTTSGQTGTSSTDGLLVGMDSTGRAIINNQESSTMSIYNNGAERITVLSNGVVGIGTTSPSQASLHVNASATKGAFRLTDTSQGAGKVLVSDIDGNATWGNASSLSGIDNTNDAFVNNSGNTRVELGTTSAGGARTAGTEFVVNDSGFVGIGTPTPTKALYVVGNGGANDDVIFESNANSNAGDSSSLSMYRSRGTNASKTAIQNGDTVGKLEFQPYSGSNYIGTNAISSVVNGTVTGTSVPTDLTFGTGTTGINERMRITSGGNVGIGTLSPTVKLDVNGRINAVDQVLVNKGATEGGQIMLQGQNATDADWTIDQINNLSTPRFRIFAGSNEDNGIAISESGNVGLGTSTPNTKLHINTTTAGAGFRLVDGTQGTGKVLSSNASGNASWVTNVAVAPTIIGETDQTAPTPPHPSGSDYAIANNTYLKRKITLPSGKWIIMVGQTFNNLKNLSSTEGYMTHIYLGGTATNTTLPAGVTRTGVMGGNVIYSASGVSISTGSFLINNTNTSDVTLYLLFGSNDYFNTSSGQTGKGQVATAAGENYLYAMPIN